MIFNKVVYVAAPKVQLAAPSNLLATPGTGKISLTWTDPEDIVRTGKTVATWAKTRIVRKEGAPPNDHNDGVIVLESTEKNQYQSTPYDDSTVQVGTVYHYGAFSYSEEGVWSEGAFVNATPMAGTPLGSLAVGTLIKIQENGAPVEFYLAKHNYEPDLNGQGRELVVRKDCYDNQVWDNGNDNDNEYSTSDLDAWLNAAYFNRLSGYVKEQLATTKFYYTPSGKARAVALDRGVFTPSITELDVDAEALNATEGSPLPIATALQIARYSGAAVNQFTRSPYKRTTQTILGVLSDGTYWSSDVFRTVGYAYARPCFTLPSTALVDQDLNLIEEVSA